MKKSILLLTGSALLLAGCAKVENEVVVPESTMKHVVLKASVNEADTRVSADAAGSYSWQAGDEIAVYTDQGTVAKLTASNGGSTADFEGDLPSDAGFGSYAFYPYADNFCAPSADDHIVFTLGGEHNFVQDATNMPMMGAITDEGVTFEAVGGVLKLIVYNIPQGVNEFRFVSTGGKKIAGNFTVTNGAIVTEDAIGAVEDTQKFLFERPESGNMVFYIPLPTGTIGAFKVEFYGEDKNTPVYEKTANADLTVGRNKLIVAPALNAAPAEEVVLWSETFTTDLTGSGSGVNEIITVSDYNGEKEGQTVISGTVDYSINSNSGTVLYKNGVSAKGAEPGELMLAKKADNKEGEFIVSGIPTEGVSSAILTFVTNYVARVTVVSNTENVTIGTRSVSGDSAPYTVSYLISIGSGVSSFSISFKNNTGSNTRIDDIVLKATIGTAPVKPTITTGKESETISAGALNASISDVKLENPLDNLGITATTDANWLSVAFTEGTFDTGAKLTATANSYNHDSEARTATVTLKATGVTKTVTFKQNASIVNNPSALTVTPGDKTFSVTWDGDDKAASYSAVYSSTALADPSEGIALSVSNDGTTFTAVPTETLVNGTTYYIYVRVATLVTTYAEKYAIASGWTEVTAIPLGIHGSVDSPYPISDAIEIMDDLENNVPTTDFYYLAGTLDQNPSYYGNGQLTFTFVDEDENSIKAYNCLGLNGTNFSSKSDLKAGDEVVVYGNLEKYVSGNTVTYEIINAYLVKLTPASTQGGQVPGSDGYCFNITSYSSIPSGWTSNNVETGSYYKVTTGGSLVSPAYNIEGYSKAVVSIQVAKYGNGTNPAAVLSVSYDGGDTWAETKTLTAPTKSTYLNPQTFELSGTFTKNVVIKLENPAGNAALRVQNYSFRVE